MKLSIDKLSSLSGWSISSPSSIGTNDHAQYIAGYNNEKSIYLKFDSSDITRVAGKTLSAAIDVTNYNTLILSVWSQKKSTSVYRTSADFSYKIKINDTNEYYLKIFPTFTDVNIGIENVTEIDRIEITAIHTDDDVLVLSEMMVETEEIGLDILTAVQEQIEYEIEKTYSNGISLGTCNGTSGNNYIIMNFPSYLDNYGVVLIDDGVNTETHQIEDNDSEKFYFNDNYDGKTLSNTFSSANVYLKFPVYINPGQLDIRLPGIAIWGLDPDPILRTGKVDTIIDTYRVNSDDFKQRPEGQILEYTILIDIESRSVELREKMARIIRKWIAKEVMWINGRYHEIYFSAKPIEIRGLENEDVLNKIQYTVKVEAREDIFDRIVVPKTTTINTTITIT